MWTFFQKCWNEVFIEPQFENITVNLKSLEFTSKGIKLSPDHIQVGNILSKWFSSNLYGKEIKPNYRLYCAISRIGGARGPPCKAEKYLDFVETITFRWEDGNWYPIIYSTYL
jgi:hypothetical protein